MERTRYGISVMILVAMLSACGGSSSSLVAEGESCNAENVCGETLFCNTPEGQCDATIGMCIVKSQICTREYVPVCGCDGKTYGNACGAAGAGVSIATRSECSSDA